MSIDNRGDCVISSSKIFWPQNLAAFAATLFNIESYDVVIELENQDDEIMIAATWEDCTVGFCATISANGTQFSMIDSCDDDGKETVNMAALDAALQELL